MTDETLGQIVTINTEQPVRQNIQDVAAQLKVPFCVEGSSTVKALLEKRISVDTNRIDVASFIASVEAVGFSIQQYTNGVLLRARDVVQIPDNPLDHTVDAFKFSGHHEAFVQKICSLFPGLPPDIAAVKGVSSSEIMYRIDVTNSISLRDLLMLSAEKSGMMWMAVIRSKAPTYVIEDMKTGVRQETSGSPVTLSFTGKL